MRVLDQPHASLVASRFVKRFSQQHLPAPPGGRVPCPHATNQEAEPEGTPTPHGEKETEPGSELGSPGTESLAIGPSFQLPGTSGGLVRPGRPSEPGGLRRTESPNKSLAFAVRSCLPLSLRLFHSQNRGTLEPPWRGRTVVSMIINNAGLRG